MSRNKLEIGNLYRCCSHPEGMYSFWRIEERPNQNPDPILNYSRISDPFMVLQIIEGTETNSYLIVIKVMTIKGIQGWIQYVNYNDYELVV